MGRTPDRKFPMKLKPALMGLMLLLGACSNPPLPPIKEGKKDPGYGQDAAECRSQAGLDQAGRNSPEAYRVQALFNRCMRYRGWPVE